MAEQESATRAMKLSQDELRPGEHMKKLILFTITTFLLICFAFTERAMVSPSCQGLNTAMISAQHPAAKDINEKYRAQSYAQRHDQQVNGNSVYISPTGKVHNFIKVGNYGSADWTTAENSPSIAVAFEDNQLLAKKSLMVGELTEFCINCLDQLSAVDSIEIILKSWGASDNTIQCIEKLSGQNR
jgi:hypothetical protein